MVSPKPAQRCPRLGAQPAMERRWEYYRSLHHRQALIHPNRLTARGSDHKNPPVPGSHRSCTACTRSGARLELTFISGGPFAVRITEVSTLKLRFSMATPM